MCTCTPSCSMVCTYTNPTRPRISPADEPALTDPLAESVAFARARVVDPRRAPPRHGPRLSRFGRRTQAACYFFRPPRRAHSARAGTSRAVTAYSPNLRARAEIVPSARAAGEAGGEPPPAPVAPAPPKARTGRYLLWHELLRRVFEIHLLACATCGGRLRLLWPVHDGFAARRDLQSVSAQATPAEARPPPAPAGAGDSPSAPGRSGGTIGSMRSRARLRGWARYARVSCARLGRPLPEMGGSSYRACHVTCTLKIGHA